MRTIRIGVVEDDGSNQSFTMLTQTVWNPLPYPKRLYISSTAHDFTAPPHFRMRSIHTHGAGNEWTDDGENNHVGRIVQAEQQSRTGDRHDKRDSADDRPAEERPSSVCTTVTFSIGEAYAREITRGKNHHYRYDHRGCRMTTRKTWIARQQTTASGRDRTGAFDQPFDADHVQYRCRRHGDIADNNAPAAGNTRIDSSERGDDCDAAYR